MLLVSLVSLLPLSSSSVLLKIKVVKVGNE